MIEFGLLGPLEVRRDGEVLRLGGHKQRLLLCALLVEADRVVPTTRLVDILWGAEPPETAPNVLQQYISQLRRLLDLAGARHALVSEAPGYRLHVDPERIDARRFEHLVTAALAAAAAGDDAAALRMGEAAEALWRGDVLADLGDEPMAIRERSRLEELRLAAMEATYEARLRRGQHAELAAELEAAAARHPLRERLQGLFMLALYRSGRQSEALAAYRRTRTLLSDELGIDPSPELRALELSILRHDRAIAAPERGAPPGSEPSAVREERKTVTVLFAELVRRAAGALLDPEDVRSLVSPSFARLRAGIEHHGGTVAQQIGDSVMALFGVPVSHEDDPERALRAALAVRTWVAEDGAFELRVAVNTGEALVTLGAGPGEHGPTASGEVITATARALAAASTNEILVGDATRRATSGVIAYGESRLVTLRGEPEPVPMWAAIEQRSRLEIDGASAMVAPLVGRHHEVQVLTESLRRVERDRSPHLVTIVGAPGIGKTRLAAELPRMAAEDPTSTWRFLQGRSLPYGDGVTFWALGEMVKTQAGILETSSPHVAEAKLDACVAQLIPDAADARWVGGHLRPLLGLGLRSDTAAGSNRRDEAFAAWRRYFEAVAGHAPLTLVFEDLQWADDDLVDFVQHLADWVNGVPLLVVCTARPELMVRRPSWARGRRQATTLALSPLSDEETGQLISNLSVRPVMAAETQQALLSRARGNPLFAEQYVRMLAATGDAQNLPLPTTVHGIIAARLDALPGDEKSLLQHAAVMGEVFWLGALIDGELDRRAAEVRLQALERKEFVQRAGHSSVANEVEYAFAHVLIRDVAYGQLPRAQRGARHRSSARWIEALGRSDDHAEMLAHHYRNAVALRQAAGEPVEPLLAESALRSLRAAGDRAVSLNSYGGAAGYYQAAVDLAPAGSADHAHLLYRLGTARAILGDVEPGTLSAACDELRECGEHEAAAGAEVTLAELHRTRGERDLAFEHLVRARALVDGKAPTPATAQVVCTVAHSLMLAQESGEAVRVGREALGIAEQLGLRDLSALALQCIGASRVDDGDLGGVTDLERGVAAALEAEGRTELCRARINLGATLSDMGRLEQGSALFDEAGATAAHFGLVALERSYRAARNFSDFTLGRWQAALVGANQFIAEVEAGSPHRMAPLCLMVRAQIRLGQDDQAGAIADTEQALEVARSGKDASILYGIVAECAHVFQEIGMHTRAGELADEFLSAQTGSRGLGPAVEYLHVAAWTLSAHGRAPALIEALPTTDVPWVRAARAYAGGDLRRAADICAGIGAATQEARVRLWLADALVDQKRRSDADVELHRALSFYSAVGATRYVRAGETLLSRSA